MLNLTQNQVNFITDATEHAYAGASFMENTAFNPSDRKAWSKIRAEIGASCFTIIGDNRHVLVGTVNDAIVGHTRLASLLSDAHKAYVANEFAINMIAVAI